MEHYKASYAILIVVLTVASCSAQTVCSLRVPVQNLDDCDASGMLEETIQADVYRTQGGIEGVQDYQTENFKILDEQLTGIITQSDSTEMNIAGVEEDITDLAHLLSNIQLVQAYDEALSRDTNAREKRAASPSQVQLQQMLNAAKVTFQRAVADVMNKLQNLTQVIDDKAKQTAATHAKFQADLTSHQNSLTTAEQQLKTIDTSVQKLVSSRNKGGGGANLTSVTQDATNLFINASVAEQIHVRQLDGVEQMIQTAETELAKLPAEIQRLTSDTNTVEAQITQDETSLARSQGGEHILEDRIGDFLTNATRDVATIQANLAANKPKITALGNQVIRVLTETAKFRKDLVTGRAKVDGVQSVVTFTNNIQQQQSSKILTMNKIALGDIKLLKYAFGLLTSYP